MKKLFFSMVCLLASTMLFAGENDLLWDYTENMPTKSPDKGLYFGGYVNDAAGTKNGLHGVKMNSSGYCYFAKAAVEGTLTLAIGPRDGAKEFYVSVYNCTIADGTATKGTLIATTEKTTDAPGTVTIDIPAEATGIYIDRGSCGTEGVVCKIEFTEKIARTFVDFEMKLCSLAAEYDVTNLPTGVTFSGTFNSDQHGYRDAIVKVPVDGTVKFSIGDCKYGKQAIPVKNAEGTTIATLNYPAEKCYNSADSDSISVFTYLYIGGADTLTFGTIQYLNYFKAEATEVKPATLTYKDQNGIVLAKYNMYQGDIIGAVPDSVNAKLNIPEGMRFRGWKYSSMKKIKATDALTGNTTITAHVTNIEEATTGTHYKYNLNQETDYIEDHDLITTDGAYYDATHGWAFNAGNRLDFVVSSKAYVSIKLCEYTNESDQDIINKSGQTVGTMHVDTATTDGELCSFYNACEGATDTLHINFRTTTYLHSIEIFNVADTLNKKGHVYDIPAGDAGMLIMVCPMLVKGDTIQLHDGLYDMGETVLTTISASNVVVRGESMDNTIVKNTPNIKKEGISVTATFLNTGDDNVFEDLTLYNAFDYYNASGDGRAVCLQDKGTRTACYNVKMLSHQDTYYSNKPGQQCWFENCEIHGTVDFICGSGSVYFYNTLLYCEKRDKNNSGQDCITANNSQTAQNDKGYVFDRCTIQSECPVISLGRAWGDQPQAAYLLTTLDTTAGKFSLSDGSKIIRWTLAGMNVCAYDFAEYSSMDLNGNVVSPASNKQTFTHTSGNKTIETIINYEDAEAKSYIHFFRDGWNPARNYVPFPAPATGCENVVVNEKAHKTIENGQLIITRDNVRYSILGTRF